MGSKPLRIWFDKIEGFIKICDGIRYLVTLSLSWFDEICDINKYFMSEKKIVLQIALIVMLQESGLIYLYKNIDFSCFNTH